MRVVHREGQGKQGHEEMYLELLPGVETFLTQVTSEQFKQFKHGERGRGRTGAEQEPGRGEQVEEQGREGSGRLRRQGQ